jgi:hypothetical protein
MDKLNENVVEARGKMTQDIIFKLSFDSSNSHSCECYRRNEYKNLEFKDGTFEFSEFGIVKEA